MTDEAPRKATVRLRRKRSLSGFLVPYRVDVGLRRIGRIWVGGVIDFEVDPGEQRVTVWSGKVRIAAETILVPNAGAEYVVGKSQSAIRSFLGTGSRPVMLRRTDRQ